MSWFFVDDGFGDSEKLGRVPPSMLLKAVGLWTLAGVWCRKQLTGGAVPKHQIERLGGTQKVALALVSCGLWEKTHTGYQFHDWADWQETREELLIKREQGKNRQRRWRDKRVANAVTNASVTPRETHVSPGEGEGYVRSERVDLSTRAHAREPWAELVRLGLASPDDVEREAIATEHEFADWGDA